MQIITQQQVHEQLTFECLIKALKKGFAVPSGTPPRNVYSLSNRSDCHDAFAVLPAWNEEFIGVKAFTYFPSNGQHGFKSLYSKVMLFDRAHGEPLALVDGTSVTLWRTACVSALASHYLSNENAKHLVFFGSGNLAPYMIKAHLSVRRINKVTLVARNAQKANELIDKLRIEHPTIEFVRGYSNEATIASADIVSCATGSKSPLFDGNWLTAGTHIDLIGNHHADCRECDSVTISRSNVFVDSKENVLKEAGELLIPISEGVFNEQSVIAQMSEMHEMSWQRNDTDITVFKSVGMALGDLLASSLVFRRLN